MHALLFWGVFFPNSLWFFCLEQVHNFLFFHIFLLLLMNLRNSVLLLKLCLRISFLYGFKGILFLHRIFLFQRILWASLLKRKLWSSLIDILKGSVFIKWELRVALVNGHLGLFLIVLWELVKDVLCLYWEVEFVESADHEVVWFAFLCEALDHAQLLWELRSAVELFLHLSEGFSNVTGTSGKLHERSWIFFVVVVIVFMRQQHEMSLHFFKDILPVEIKDIINPWVSTKFDVVKFRVRRIFAAGRKFVGGHVE